jgi:hypothetical protein
MSGRYYTLGNFPPEDAWGVFATGTCPDLGGRIVPEYHYCQYDEAPGVFQLLLQVRETFLELGVRPQPGLIYPTLEEMQSWEAGGQDSWRKRSGK